MELEADAEAALLVCPRSPALASANQKSRESMSSAVTARREKHTARIADCEPVVFQAVSKNVVLNTANTMKSEFLSA